MKYLSVDLILIQWHFIRVGVGGAPLWVLNLSDVLYPECSWQWRVKAVTECFCTFFNQCHSESVGIQTVNTWFTHGFLPHMHLFRQNTHQIMNCVKRPSLCHCLNTYFLSDVRTCHTFIFIFFSSVATFSESLFFLIVLPAHTLPHISQTFNTFYGLDPAYLHIFSCVPSFSDSVSWMLQTKSAWKNHSFWQI